MSDWSSDVCSSDRTRWLMDLEAGTLSLQNWRGDVIDVRKEAAALGVHPWEFARAMACLLCGPDPAAPPESPYSQAWYDRSREAIAPPETSLGRASCRGRVWQYV